MDLRYWGSVEILIYVKLNVNKLSRFKKRKVENFHYGVQV